MYKILFYNIIGTERPRTITLYCPHSVVGGERRRRREEVKRIVRKKITRYYIIILKVLQFLIPRTVLQNSTDEYLLLTSGKNIISITNVV